MPKISLFICTLILFLSTKSQVIDSLLCKTSGATTIKAYFEGYSIKDTTKNVAWFNIKESFFQKDFSLLLSDNSYKIISYRFVFDCPDNGYITEFTTQGATTIVNKNSLTKRLLNMTTTCFISVENIIVSKNGECFKVAPFVCSLIK